VDYVVSPQAASPVQTLPDLTRQVADAGDPTRVGAGVPTAIEVGLIGYGYWGPNLVRNFAEIPGSHVRVVSDLRQERLNEILARYPDTTATRDYQAVIGDPAVDAVVIMTPVGNHFELGLQALRAGKHVLMAHPLATSSEQATRLIEEADRRRRVLMVDHTSVYGGAVRRIKELVDSGSLGRLHYYDAVRVNLGLFQHETNVLWDLAVHDLSVMDYVLGRYPRSVTATGAAHVPGHPVNMAYVTCFFEDSLLAHHHANWLAPVKVRRTLICGSMQMIVYDDLEPSEKIKVYDKGVTLGTSPERVYETLVGYRTGDMWAPQFSLTEALRVEAHHFLDCIRNGTQPLTDGASALRVIRIIEAATQSLVLEGQPVKLSLDQNPDRQIH
jgi:predicted dehydrogenase